MYADPDPVPVLQVPAGPGEEGGLGGISILLKEEKEEEEEKKADDDDEEKMEWKEEGSGGDAGQLCCGGAIMDKFPLNPLPLAFFPCSSCLKVLSS